MKTKIPYQDEATVCKWDVWKESGWRPSRIQGHGGVYSLAGRGAESHCRVVSSFRIEQNLKKAIKDL